METATLAGGCFWCTEAVFQEIKGVNKVVSGFSGGHLEEPTYEQMHTQDTGHAECVQITFDPNIISYAQLLEVFYYTHNPTTLNQDGANIGPEYRSEIFYHNQKQHKIAEEVQATFAKELWSDPIVTKITKFEKFWPAGEEHQNFYKKHPEQAYCQVIINPKLNKFKAKFAKLVK